MAHSPLAAKLFLVLNTKRVANKVTMFYELLKGGYSWYAGPLHLPLLLSFTLWMDHTDGPHDHYFLSSFSFFTMSENSVRQGGKHKETDADGSVQ